MKLRRKIVASVAALMVAGTMLTVGAGDQAAVAAKKRIVCKPAEGRALMYNRGKAIGYFKMSLRYCWEVFNDVPSHNLSAKVTAYRYQMPPDTPKGCHYNITRSLYSTKAWVKKHSAKSWTITAQGLYKTRQYADTYPRDCKYAYQMTMGWAPKVAITVNTGGKVGVSAPSVSGSLYRE